MIIHYSIKLFLNLLYREEIYSLVIIILMMMAKEEGEQPMPPAEPRRRRLVARSGEVKEKDGVVVNRYVNIPGAVPPRLGWHTDGLRDLFYGRMPVRQLNVTLRPDGWTSHPIEPNASKLWWQDKYKVRD